LARRGFSMWDRILKFKKKKKKNNPPKRTGENPRSRKGNQNER